MNGKGYLLALETSSSEGGVALLKDGVPVAARTLGEGMRHGQLLLPAAEAILKDAGVAVRDLAAIAVSVGPGGYTGIRIGVMAAKCLSWGGGVPLVAVSSLAALAWTARELGARIAPFMDARRDEVYTAVYGVTEAGVEGVEGDRACTPEEAVSMARAWGAVVVGSAAGRYRELMGAAEGAGLVCRGEPGSPSPEAVGYLGWMEYVAGRVVDPLVLQPTYMRRDDAPCAFERVPESGTGM